MESRCTMISLIICSLASTFGKPRNRVFRYRNIPLTTAKTCSTLDRMEDLACSAARAFSCSASGSFFSEERRLLILKEIFFPSQFSFGTSSRWSIPRYPLSPNTSSSVPSSNSDTGVESCTLAAVVSTLLTNPVSRSTPICPLNPKYHWFPFFT